MNDPITLAKSSTNKTVLYKIPLKKMERFTADLARASQRENFTQLYEIYELIKKEVEKKNNPNRHLDIDVSSHEYYEENPSKWEYITGELEKDGYEVHYNRYHYQYRI